MQLIDGRAIAAQIREELKQAISASKLHPKLCVLLVGADPASHLYVKLKAQAAHEVGIDVDIRRLTADVSDDELKHDLEIWNKDESVDGILVQLPLPSGHSTDAIIQTIDPNKDADGFHPENTALLLTGHGRIIPPLHEGILRLIASTDIRLNTARAVIVAKSETFYRPLEYLLHKTGVHVDILPPEDLDRRALLTAQLIIVAAGSAALLDRSLIPAHACVIDLGTNRTSDGKIVGDVDAQSLAEMPGWITPVPGGVGPMTIAMLLKNVWRLAQYRRGRQA